MLGAGAGGFYGGAGCGSCCGDRRASGAGYAGACAGGGYGCAGGPEAYGWTS